jgi:putative nucleotidyltransferase with HDIG domain
MAASGQKRTRSERVAALELAPGQWERAWASLRRRDVLGRIGLALLAALIMAALIRAWDPPAGQGQWAAGQKITTAPGESPAALHEPTPSQRLARAAAVVVMIFVMLVLCGIYMRYRQHGPLASLTRLSVMLALAVITVALSWWASVGPWRAEIVPLMIFGMTMAIVYGQELAVLLCTVLALVLALAVRQGLHEFVLLMGVTTTANLNLARIRSRSKLIYVGLFAGGVAALLAAGLGILDNQPLSRALLEGASRNGLWAVAAGFLMTGLLPFVERLFGVLTDLSLLELGDVSHPLLRELVRRAASTYSHSVTVGSIGEAAAESIGVRGLLVRVGAYFHDIGKMLKPTYYAENQGPEDNRHEALVPAMSSLIIVAHIKDGADLARKHHLPQPIIDLIEQHHGTTRVGFFYERASEQKRSDPNGSDVDESTYRYPGPKPQTKEAPC